MKEEKEENSDITSIVGRICLEAYGGNSIEAYEKEQEFAFNNNIYPKDIKNLESVPAEILKKINKKTDPRIKANVPWENFEGNKF